MTAPSPTVQNSATGANHIPSSQANFYIAAGCWQSETLWDLLLRGAREFQSSIAVEDEELALSYVELLDAAQRAGGALSSSGVLAREPVVVQLGNRVAWFSACFALWKLGCVPVMANPAHGWRDVAHFIRVSGATTLLADTEMRSTDYYRRLRELFPELRILRVDGVSKFTELERDSRDQGYAASPLGADASNSLSLALLQLSGGSTGQPKLIPRTHADYLYSVRESARLCGLDRESRMLVVLPVSHNFPLSSPGALGILYSGGTVLLARSGAPHTAFSWFARRDVTHTAVVPPLALAWHRAVRAGAHPPPNLRALQVGGAPLLPRVAKQLVDAFGPCLQQVFGMAEGLVCYTRPGDPLETKLNTQGRPLSDLDEVRIVNDADQNVATGEIGHLLTRGPYTIRGYFNAPDHNPRSFTDDGYYRTGDLVQQTAEGNLIVRGRSKDQINRGGEKVACPEVEDALMEHPAVLEAALVPTSDEFLGERACAFLVTAHPVRARQLRTHLQALGLSPYKIPDRFERIAKLPVTSIGKVDKLALRLLLV